jgi:O-acetyl-ADP-ribose deacetylase (regulator of RNase III)
MKVVQGDLIELAQSGEFDVIVHGCNCQCAMGAGIAKAIKAAFPAAYDADRKTTKGDRAKLGTISTADVDLAGRTLTVVNAYTQFHWRGKKPLADYDAICGAFRAIKQRYSGRRIGYPRIGAGSAGGDWSVISAIIDEELASEDHTLVEFSG